jgi:hypothetical protein
MKMAALRPEVKVAGLVLLFGLLFAAYTQHVWEDYWITFRSSRNLATGNGLVYTPGERLHSFTSPLGVLLPAVFCRLTGNQSDALVLWLFRLTSLAALAAGMILIFRALQFARFRRVSIWLTLALIGLDAKLVDFSTNGMETGLLFFFLALTIYGLVESGRLQWVRLGIAWAGLMWVRPDSCVYIAILAMGTLFFLAGGTADKSRWVWCKRLSAGGLICAALYLPWFLWAWWYYGSPIPHTIIAKATNHPPIFFIDLITSLYAFPFQGSGLSIPYTFLPAYALGGWPGWLYPATYWLGLLAALAWLVPGLRPETRLFSFAYYFGNYFLTVIVGTYFPWYLPAVAVLGYLSIGLIFDEALSLATKWAPSGDRRRWSGWLLSALYASGFALLAGEAILTACVARQMRVQQELIENGLRRPMGLWLHDHARTVQDTVLLEPLGYIGYYSGLKMLDFPGLASKEMVAARKRLGPNQENRAFEELRPDWVVLRPAERDDALYTNLRSLFKDYELVRVFDVANKVSATRWLPGRTYVEYDQTFFIYHRKPSLNPNPPNWIN